ncbi:hypothetical protein HNO88_000629 [Novosphingobium chloroacetimidivorans]|uniref:Uncharacterized protein n=1 Tax=Novosphingobium chloroacetimidivorans TaxID=1428314 RepID=A0A7W7K6X2_9SPHN|nr:hypothetical protein [Novosphingobium chloroacetimidivorans]
MQVAHVTFGTTDLANSWRCECDPDDDTLNTFCMPAGS